MGKKTSYCQLGLAIGFACAIAVGCGGSIAPAPTCKPSETPPLHVYEGIQKIDLLLAIDNSASMADKAELFSQAIPGLLEALLSPECTNGSKRVKPSGSPGALTCPSGYTFEFAPLHDLHIGVVTSSLGGGGSPDVCDGTGPVPTGFTRHDDDHGRLVTRTKPTGGGGEGAVAATKPKDGTGGGFLAWLPPTDPANQGAVQPNVTVSPDGPTLTTDFQSLVRGAQEFGCGLEAPLESWYHFLVQPDPWADIPKSSGGASPTTLNGVDAVVLKQRKDFLREDSLLAIVMLTDEEDSWSDPLALGGRGWVTRTQSFPSSQAKQPGTMPRPTSECLQPIDPNNPTKTGPNNPACTSCGFTGNKLDNTPIASDPQCQTACGANCQGFYTSAEDNLNVRYTNDMKRRYGFDPQFPVERYVDGLKSLKVPNRDGEHKGGAGAYVGTKNCTNPLFARDLPDGSDLSDATLCNAKIGPRTPDLVLFTVVGGVPWQLLAQDPGNDSSGFKASLSSDDWVKILGKDPATYQSEGIDPHMIESITPRAGLPPTTASNTADPIHGREWKTSLSAPGLDLQYACSFPLPVPKDCTLPENAATCDCKGAAAGPEGSPLCNGTLQVRGKAYPTIRQLRVAKALGTQGVVSSLCAKNFGDATQPNWALRPLVDALRSRLIVSVSQSCYPTAHARGADGKVACKVMVALAGKKSSCDPNHGLTPASASDGDCFRAEVLTRLKERNPDATDYDVGAVCELAQLAPPYQNGTCEKSATPGWCWVVPSDGGGTCPQQILFSETGKAPPGSYIGLRCE